MNKICGLRLRVLKIQFSSFKFFKLSRRNHFFLQNSILKSFVLKLSSIMFKALKVLITKKMHHSQNKDN